VDTQARIVTKNIANTNANDSSGLQPEVWTLRKDLRGSKYKEKSTNDSSGGDDDDIDSVAQSLAAPCSEKDDLDSDSSSTVSEDDYVI